MAVTIKQIAEQANVSRGTVDRVIHGRYGVDPAIRSRVLKIIAELDYKPNALARALKGVSNLLKLGVIVPSRMNPFFCAVHEGIDEAAKSVAAYGIEVIKLEIESVTAQTQIDCIDQMEALDVKGIMLVPLDDDRVRSRINQLPDNIQVVTFNSDISGTKRLCFVGSDHIAAGRVAGQLLSMLLETRGRVALLISQNDLLAHAERVAGFSEVLREARPHLELIGPFMTYESEDAAHELVCRLVRDERDLIGIYAAGGGQQAAARALAESDRAGQVRMVCHDLLPETIKYIKSGVVDFTIGQEPFVQGYMPVQILYEYYMFGHKPKRNKLFTSVDIRVKHNVDHMGYEVFTGHYKVQRNT